MNAYRPGPGAAIRAALEWMAKPAQRVVVAYAAPDAGLANQVATWQGEGIAVDILAGND